MRTLPKFAAAVVFSAMVLGLGAPTALGERISDIANTVHNLSVSGSGTVRAGSEDELCVFCHTPHAASTSVTGPLWNRASGASSYTPYASSSLDAVGLDQPGGSSKLCLSCHDGTIAIGSVNVLNGAFTDQDPGTEDITMQGTDGGVMPAGQGISTGFTRLLGTDLSNDHPISFTYDDALATLDGELRAPSSSSHIGNRSPGVKPDVPLENGEVQCTSCHDPHIRDTIESDIKFLRLYRLQQTPPVAGAFDETNDQLCLACHNKDGWADSAHANDLVADETYESTAASLRDFTANMPVWKAACLNCHDTHTVEGSRRLLREGTDSITTPKSGGNSAVEETCYQCHSSTGAVLNNQGTNGFAVPDIRTDFQKARTMPIDDQPEVHDIGTGTESQPGMDFLESQEKLGLNAPENRHVECTDCHNPHRVIKNRQFNDSASVPDAAGTHNHAAGHTNIASGVLRGTWGVEPIYSSTDFNTPPGSFEIKRGTPPPGATDDVGNTFLTREYQLCMKCHSNFAYSTPPSLGCCTPSGTDNLTEYTNQAQEFQAPSADKGEPGGNHRSWHPVMDSTGRSLSVRGSMSSSLFLSPWNGSSDVGTQTMYCSDCHGSGTASGTVEPSGGEDGDPWGPHGSNNDFILKGVYDAGTGAGSSNDLCFKCHSYSHYATENSTRSGFCCDRDNNLHGLHAKRIDSGIKCNYCHVAVPHGWKHKALLVDLNDVGPEAGLAPGTKVSGRYYTKAPYYRNAALRILNWASSGNWSETDCGSSGSNDGKDWMRDTCETGP